MTLGDLGWNIKQYNIKTADIAAVFMSSQCSTQSGNFATYV